MASIEIGKTYKVNHSRKGTFHLKVTAVDDAWVTGLIASGKAGAIIPENEVYEGEAITLRASFCVFSEV